jgi:hypothetical protein
MTMATTVCCELEERMDGKLKTLERAIKEQLLHLEIDRGGGGAPLLPTSREELRQLEARLAPKSALASTQARVKELEKEMDQLRSACVSKSVFSVALEAIDAIKELSVQNEGQLKELMIPCTAASSIPGKNAKNPTNEELERLCSKTIEKRVLPVLEDLKQKQRLMDATSAKLGSRLDELQVAAAKERDGTLNLPSPQDRRLHETMGAFAERLDKLQDQLQTVQRLFSAQLGKIVEQSASDRASFERTVVKLSQQLDYCSRAIQEASPAPSARRTSMSLDRTLVEVDTTKQQRHGNVPSSGTESTPPHERWADARAPEFDESFSLDMDALDAKLQELRVRFG